MNLNKVIIIAVCAVLSFSAPAQELLFNGSFESPVIQENTFSDTIPTSWGGMPIYDATGVIHLLNGDYGVPEYPGPNAGNQYMELVGDRPALYQVFTAVNPGTYKLSWSDNTAGYILDAYHAYAVVISSGVVPSFAEPAFIVSKTNVLSAQGWFSRSMQFNLNPGTYTIAFVGLSDPPSLIDGVSLQPPQGPLAFEGFLSPIGGGDATGGSYNSPLRTFKLNSTIPVKFIVSSGGSPVLNGVHTLELIKWSSQTDSDSPIDATPTDAATTGDQFRLVGSQWHFNLDTQATGMSVGTWQLIATLSDGSEHFAWIQIK